MKVGKQGIECKKHSQCASGSTWPWCNNNSILNMTLGSESRRLFKKLDKFSTTELLRYKEETEYATYTGACLSIIVVALMVLLAANLIIETVNKERINSRASMTMEAIPSNYTFELSTFKFGLEMDGIELWDWDEDLSYFDLVIGEISYANGSETVDYFEYERCRPEDWQATPQIRQTFEDNDGQYWVCPVQNQSASLYGNYANRESNTFKIEVYACGTFFPWKENCANNSQIEEMYAANFGYLTFTVYTVNTQVQPGEPQPYLHFLDDTHKLIIGRAIGQIAVLEIAEYEFTTDHSLWPWTDVVTESGAFVREKASVSSTEKVFGLQSAFYISKSRAKFAYERSFYRYDEAFSYVGGMISMAVAIFIFFLPYTQLCYQFSLCSQLFVDEQGQPLSLSFNFLKYLIYQVYYFITYFFSCCKVKEYELYKTCSDQVQRELDVAYLYKRINTLERVVTQTNKNLLPQQYRYHKMTFEESQRKMDTVCQPPSDSELKQGMDLIVSISQELIGSSQGTEKQKNGHSPSKEVRREQEIRPNVPSPRRKQEQSLAHKFKGRHAASLSSESQRPFVEQNLHEGRNQRSKPAND